MWTLVDGKRVRDARVEHSPCFVQGSYGLDGAAERAALCITSRLMKSRHENQKEQYVQFHLRVYIDQASHVYVGRIQYHTSACQLVTVDMSTPCPSYELRSETTSAGDVKSSFSRSIRTDLASLLFNCTDYTTVTNERGLENLT